MDAIPLMRLAEKDIRFIIETVDARLMDKLDIIKGDPAILERMLETNAERLFQRIAGMAQDSLLTKITPRLLFEILLRKASDEIGNQPYILERTALQSIPVFDTHRVADFLRDKSMIRYLADMLDSFTRTESYTVPVRIRKGIWRKIRYSDIDLTSLLRLCRSDDEEQRFLIYKRIADLCLFILGIFPEYAQHLNLDRLFTGSKTVRPFGFLRHDYDYVEEGKRFYKLAAEHENARILGLNQVFLRLHDEFELARRPLNYISEHYLHFRKGGLFPSITPN